MATEGFSNFPSNEIKLSSETIERIPPPVDGTVIIMQRHGNYDRETGHLTPDGRSETLERSQKIIQEIIEKVPEDERSSIGLLVVASPTVRNEGQRSMETASAVIESVQNVFGKYNIPKENIMTDVPRPTQDIEEPRIFDGDTTYLKFLVEKYGKDTKEFWIAYEEDVHEEERKKMGAEGPVDMSDRFAHFTNVLGRYAHLYHTKHQGEPSRLIIWNVSHYDTITTYFKNHVAMIDQKEYVPVDYDGGVSLVIDSESKASITVGGKIFPIELTKKGTALKRKTESK